MRKKKPQNYSKFSSNRSFFHGHLIYFEYFRHKLLIVVVSIMKQNFYIDHVFLVKKPLYDSLFLPLISAANSHNSCILHLIIHYHFLSFSLYLKPTPKLFVKPLVIVKSGRFSDHLQIKPFAEKLIGS